MKHVYDRSVTEASIPDGIRFDVPRQNQGQMVEVAYGGFGRAENDAGDPYMRVHDRSDNTTSFWAHTCGPACPWMPKGKVAR